MVRNIAIIACLTVLLLGLLPTVSSAQDLREIVRNYIDAHNDHNVEAVMAFYADNARYEEEGFFYREGLSELRTKEEWDRAVNGALEVRKMQLRGNTVKGEASEFSDYYSAAGVETYHYDEIVFTFEGTKIKEIKVVPNSDSSTAFTNALGQFVVWCSNPDHGVNVSNLKEGGMWAYTANTAQHWINYLQKWKATAN